MGVKIGPSRLDRRFRWGLMAWVATGYLVTLVRTFTDGGAVWTHDTTWIFLFQAIYFHLVLIDRWPEITTMLLTPVLIGHETNVLLAVIWMTYTDAGILKDSYAEVGYAVTFLGSIALHLLTWALLTLYLTVFGENTVRTRTHMYLQHYTSLGFKFYYYTLTSITAEVFLASYYFWFSPRQYYQIESLSSAAIIVTSAGVLGAAMALYWVWVRIVVPGHVE